MVVCKYFLEGRCAFGDGCRYEHTLDGGSDFGGFRPRQQSYAPRYQQPRPRYDSSYQAAPVQSFRPPRYEAPPRFSAPHSAATTDTEILNTIGKDIEEMWSQNPNGIFHPGRIWPFSTYSFTSPDGEIKTDPLFDFQDLSPEELRFHTMAAAQNGTVNQFITEMASEGNRRRLRCTEIYNATGNPNSEAARQLITQVRKSSGGRQQQMASSHVPLFTNPVTQFAPPVPAGAASAAPSVAQMQYAQQVAPPVHQNFGATGASQQAFQPPSYTQPTIPEPRAMSNGIYSDTNMLTADDFEQFAAPEFVQGKVPYRPPPRNLC